MKDFGDANVCLFYPIGWIIYQTNCFERKGKLILVD